MSFTDLMTGWPPDDAPQPGVKGPLRLLRETLLAALSDAIAYRRDKYVHCGDCFPPPGGLCDDHRDDYEAAHDYEAAQKIIASATSRGTP